MKHSPNHHSYRILRGIALIVFTVPMPLFAFAACESSAETGDTAAAASTSTSSGGSGGQGGSGNTAGCTATPLEDSKVLSDACGIFVSPNGDDTNGDGTSQKPFRTLTHALDQQKDGLTRIYACAGDYPESVAIPAGYSLFGGLDCSALPWKPGADSDRSTISAAPGEIALSILSTADSQTLTRVDGVSANAAKAAVSGGSSIAVLVDQNPNVQLSRCDFLAADAMDGAPGENAPQDIPATPMASAANKGTAACTNSMLNNGGLPTTHLCASGEMSIGGAGGDGTVLVGQAGQDGSPADPNMPLSGKGGAGDVACGMGSGTTGANGVSGAPGGGGAGLGTLTSDTGWLGVAGADGGHGKVGQGGGGGGGRKGSGACAGAGGGAGGAGACGGEGGRGGQGGGSSIALISINSNVQLTSVTLSAGLGGNGGKGGDAQLGGSGGKGSVGGASNGMLPAGCPGGDGGDGGNGGTGGGGNGGHSLGIAFQGTAPTGTLQVMSFQTAGKGGPGGNGGVQMNGGETGKAQEQLEFPAP